MSFKKKKASDKIERLNIPNPLCETHGETESRLDLRGVPGLGLTPNSNVQPDCNPGSKPQSNPRESSVIDKCFLHKPNTTKHHKANKRKTTRRLARERGRKAYVEEGVPRPSKRCAVHLRV